MKLGIYGKYKNKWKCLMITHDGWGVGIRIMEACAASFGKREYELREVNKKVDKLKVDNG